MKLSVISLCRGAVATAFALVALNVASAFGEFEGRIHMDVTSGKKKEHMGLDYAVKEGKLRINSQAPESAHRGGGGMGGMIMDSKAREIIILLDMNGQKMYMRRPIPEAQAGSGKAGGDHQPHSSPPVATGRTETIAGYTATEYRTTGEHGETIEMWMAKGLGPFMSFSGGNPMAGRGAPSPGWESFARDGNFFPMRVVSRDAKGNEESRMEVTKVEKTSVPDSEFSIDGYTEFNMGAFNPFRR